MHILSLTPDLFFSTRIQSTLERAGHTIRVVDQATASAIDHALTESAPALVILDIGAGWWPWDEALQHVRAHAPEVPVLAFGSHMDVDGTKRALALGATRVVAKSAFVTRMVELAVRYVSTRAGE